MVLLTETIKKTRESKKCAIAMETEEIKSLKVEFKGEEADKFKTAIKKIHEDTSRAGFNNTSLSSDELKLLKELNQKLNP
jgi:hypothetical protein